MHIYLSSVTLVKLKSLFRLIICRMMRRWVSKIVPQKRLVIDFRRWKLIRCVFISLRIFRLLPGLPGPLYHRRMRGGRWCTSEKNHLRTTRQLGDNQPCFWYNYENLYRKIHKDSYCEVVIFC